jgi:hypothetical protein
MLQRKVAPVLVPPAVLGWPARAVPMMKEQQAEGRLGQDYFLNSRDTGLWLVVSSEQLECQAVLMSRMERTSRW